MNEEFEKKREEEFRSIPEHPKDITYRERYRQLDNYLLSNILHFDKEVGGRTISVLDFAGGVIESGSPTAHDLYEKIDEKGNKPKMTVVDQALPSNLDPLYTDIVFKHSLDELEDDKKFNIVRALHIVDHVSAEEYEEMRGRLIEKLEEGGIFISTQQMGYWKRGSYGYEDRQRPNVIKIMQKRDKELVPLALFPDSLIPVRQNIYTQSDEDFFEEYANFRKALEEGKIELEKKLDREGYVRTISTMHKASPGVINVEHFLKALQYSPQLYSDKDKGLEIFKKMGENRKNASQLFFQNLK